MSLFLEISFDSDVKPRLINQVVKKLVVEKNDRPILIFEKTKDEKTAFVRESQAK
jgi:hypothetical protein